MESYCWVAIYTVSVWVPCSTGVACLCVLHDIMPIRAMIWMMIMSMTQSDMHEIELLLLSFCFMMFRFIFLQCHPPLHTQRRRGTAASSLSVTPWCVYGSPRCCIISITIFGVNFLHPSFQPNPLRADWRLWLLLIQSLSLRRAAELVTRGK